MTRKPSLMATSALALWAVAAPAAAQTAAGPVDDRTAAPSAGGERLVAMGGKGGGGGGGGENIRPFGGDARASGGNIRGFAGPLVGTGGNIRAFTTELEASGGNIRAFGGNIRAFGGNIRAFTADVNPSAGPETSFWGALTPMAGSVSANGGNIRAFMGDLEAWGGNIRAFGGNIRAFGGNIRAFEEIPDTYAGMNAAIRDLVDRSALAFGAAVQARTGQSFQTGFADKLLAKYGIDLNDPRSLVGLNELGIELFLLDWQDNLLNYSGQDQVDHWMKAVNWSPALTQNMGMGRDTRIGVLDFTITGDASENVVASSGVSTVASGHGSAVASLIAGRHDGRGVMGIAPAAQVFGYNPFDATYTAGWTDIKNGVKYLLDQGASVVNLSLGVSGSTFAAGWNDVFKDAKLWDAAKTHTFVFAAGNDGVTQTQNVVFDGPKVNNVIVVGSVDPNGVVSAFSNRPGEACLTMPDGKCPAGAKLKERFITAPGEFLLVSDGQGGVTRMSGTSFAAPLVSGTIALVHDRWPWLADKPKDTANIILGSARDVGDPGVDGVYGRGLLDVQAALSPLSWGNNLKWKVSTRGADARDVNPDDILKTKAGTVSLWEANGVYFTIFEDTGDSFRDFSIPLSTKLVGKTVGTSGEQFNAYLQSRFWSWFNAGRNCTTTNCDKNVGGFANRYLTARMANVAGLETTAYATRREYRPGLRRSGAPFDTALALSSAEHGFRFDVGSGDGAAITGRHGFGLRSDHDVLTGGADPFLGLASGGGYASAELRIGERLTVSAGASRQREKVDLRFLDEGRRRVLGSMDAYSASAGTMTAAYRVGPALTTSLSYTLLDEATGLLGMRSADRSDLRGGSATDAATVGADYAAGPTLTVSATATLGRTRAGDREQGIAVSNGGLVSSAWQVAVAKQGVLGRADRLRVTLAQPLHVEHGSIDVTGEAVVDRLTGEIGDVTQTTALRTGPRRFVAEAMYGRAFLDGAAELNLFGRASLRGDDRAQAALTLGGNVSLGF